MNPPVPDHRMPGVGAAAAVLGLVESGLALVVVTAILVEEADGYSSGGDAGLMALVLLIILGLAGLTAVGSMLVLRRASRALLVGATVAELVGIAGLWVVVLVEFSTDDYGPGVWAAATAMAVVAATTPVVRLVLVSRPSVTAWISHRPPAEPVWSAEQQQWVPRRSSTAGVALAVLTPVLLLAAMTAVVLSTQEEQVDYLVPPGISGD